MHKSAVLCVLRTESFRSDCRRRQAALFDVFGLSSDGLAAAVAHCCLHSEKVSAYNA